MSDQRISTNFSKGLNLSISHMIGLEELQQADNFMFSNGAFVREGTVVNASLPFPIVSLKKHYRRNGTAYIAAFAGGKVYLSYTSGTFVNVSCETLVSGDISVTAYDDYLYFSNLSNAVKTFDGSGIDNAGLSGPVFIKYIGDFENNSSWYIVDGSLTKDTNYMHIDKGENSLLLGAPPSATGSRTVNFSNRLNLEVFAPDVPSTSNDLIQIFTIPVKKTQISSMLLAFVTSVSTNNPSAEVFLSQLSSWVYCSNDSWSMTHNIPKALFTTNSGFSWGSCVAKIYLYPDASVSAAVAIDNLRLVKTPPVVAARAVSGGGLYFGYTPIKSDRYAQTPNLVDSPPLTEWTSLSSDSVNGAFLDGVTYHKVTFVKQGPGGLEIESNPSFQTSGVVLSADSVGHFIPSLSEIPIAPANLGVAGRKIYRRNSLEAEMRYVYTIADNTATVFDDTIPQEALGGILDEDHNPPPQSKFIYTASTQQTYYLNLIEDGTIQNSRVRYSKQYAPHYVPFDNVFDVNPNDGSEINGVFEFMNILHILKGHSTWMLDNGNLTQAHNTYGCIAPKSLAVGPNEVFWLSDEGIIKYSLRFKNISLEDSKVEPLLKGINRVYLQNAAGIYYRGLYLLAMSDGTSAVNNMVLCYDNSNDVWSIFPNVQVNCWDVWSGAKDGYRLFYGNNSGLVCEFLTGHTDFGAAIPWAVRTKEFGNPEPTTYLREVYLYTKSLDSSSHTVSVTPYYDFKIASGNTISVTSGYQLHKADIPPDDGAGYISVGFSGTGRIQLLHMDAFGKAEGLR